MAWWEFLLAAAIAYLLVAPPKYDPAIRLKEWMLKKRGER